MNANDDFLEARVRVSREQVPAVEALMAGQGALAVTLTDVADHPVLEPAPGETPLWPEVEVCGLFPADAPAARLKAAVSLAPGVEQEDRVRLGSLEDRDWARAWMDRFGPMRFGDSLWIVPTHLKPPEPGATVIRLDPGLAFGTGTHPSTHLCLEWIDGARLEGASVVDFGCGSGVLAIAAALKGARQVIAVDNDPQALLATAENAERNGVADRIHMVSAEAFETSEADVVMANILAGTLIRLAPLLSAAVRPGGTLVLAGILDYQAPAVAAAYAGRFPHLRQSILGEWICLAGQAERNHGN
jgi:ribosomal protein L11 methyltransferase